MSAATSPARTAVGTMLGTPIVASTEYFLRKYGAAAGHEVIARVPAKWRELLRPHAPALGLLGARRYPYAFIGDMVRTMRDVVRAPSEEAFVRELAIAGVEASLHTVARVLLRTTTTPKVIAEHAVASWRSFHDTGQLTVLSITDHEYAVRIDDWTGHDVIVCQVTVETRRWIIGRTGAKNVRATREKCVGWGHDACVSRVRWE
jgi:hypothetical protein